MSRVVGDKIDKSKIELMYAQHVAGTSVAQIATFYNVSKQALHYHFKLRGLETLKNKRARKEPFDYYSGNSFANYVLKNGGIHV